jgi:DNA-binding MarR family transcriptional regulator
VHKPATRALDYAALALFRYQIRRYLNFGQQAARRRGIEPQQYQALLAIKGCRVELSATVGLLAEQMQIEHHTAAELSSRLETNGWICRSRRPQDRREVLLRLTRRGERLLESLSLLHRRELQSAGPRLIEALQSAIARNKRVMAIRRSRRR